MKSDKVVRGIAAFQIYGAAATAVQTLAVAPRYDWSLPTTLVIVFFLAFALLGFFSGLRLWAGERGGYRWSIVAQSIQTPVITTNLLIYHLIPTFGVQFGFMYPTIDIGFLFYQGASLRLFVGNQLESGSLGVSVIPVLCILYLVKARRARGEPQVSAIDA